MSRTGNRVGVGWLAVGWLLLAAPVELHGQWEAECSQPPVMPSVDERFGPIPRPGMWEIDGYRGRGGGRFQLVVEDCGQRLAPGGAAVKLGGGQLRFVPLDRQENGDYAASETYPGDGVAVTVSWRLTPVTTEAMNGTLTIYGRPGRIELKHLEGVPYQEVMQCECDAVRRKRAEYVQLRELYRGAGAGGGGAGGGTTDVDDDVDDAISDQGGVAETEWATHPGTCTVRQGSLDSSFPTQGSYETSAASGWEHELVHRDRCCSMNRTRADWDAQFDGELQQLEGARLIGGLSDEREARYQELLRSRPPTYVEWSRDPANDAQDEIEGYDAGIASLDGWLNENCPGG